MFSERLRQARLEYGISQVDLAKKLGIGKDLYNKYEKTGIRPSIETIGKIAEILNVSTDYLIGTTDTPTPQDELLRKINQSGIEESNAGYVIGFQGEKSEKIELSREEFEALKDVLSAIRKNEIKK